MKSFQDNLRLSPNGCLNQWIFSFSLWIPDSSLPMDCADSKEILNSRDAYL